MNATTENHWLRKLFDCDSTEKFEYLAPNFAAQINPFYCGPACAAIVLNALADYEASQHATNATNAYSSIEENFPYFTQANVLNSETDATIKHRDIIEYRKPADKNDPESFDPGFSLAELVRLLEHHGALAKPVYARAGEPNGNLPEFRESLEESYRRPECKSFIICNYLGKALKHTTGGHFSVIGAYESSHDEALLMDVARHKSHWSWVSIEELHNAMSPPHGTRGWIRITK